ncbi:GspH/FimT family pseudopilin [Neptunomonas antarctica]|uniref:Type II secretion system protein H n=1 Tax=Neptunomonas antarctica TaxID=619304 RepID=A0A1N7MGL2_9GAMM|nr:GspH/FimT family pseudopilin [Neptunomonas antarctica]SIS85131.1 type IV fimbrial biogenesis protein FimT [Neptunomonas antarctica]
MNMDVRYARFYRAEYKQSGFTLIELMISIALLVILITVAIPSFVSLLARTQVVSSAQTLRSALSIARSESIKRDWQVRVCNLESINSIACNGTSQVGTKIWSSGLLVFHDVNDDRVFTEGVDETVRVYSFPAGISATWNRGDGLNYLPSGRLDWGSNGTFEMNLDNSDYSIHLVLNSTGRVRSFEP